MMGPHQSGKTTLIHLLESALNKAAINEFMLAVQDKRKLKMVDLVLAYEHDHLLEMEAEIQKEALKANLANEFIGGNAKKKKLKNEKEIQY
jgi:hypothetical protein